MVHLSIGMLAKQAGMTIDTIRYYEREGLIAPPARRASGYRDYAPDMVGRLRFIRRAKDLGFTLVEIAELLALASQGERDMAGMKFAARTKLGLVEEKIRELQRICKGLKRLIDACPGHGDLATCPIVNALNQESSS